MVASMTGYGRGEAAAGGIAVTVELRSVNSRFLEITTRLPRSLSLRESEIKELIKREISRGKITLLTVVERQNDAVLPLKINVPVAKTYYTLLSQLKKAVGLREPVKLDHLLRYSEIIEQEELENTDEAEWKVFEDALRRAITELQRMRHNEGGELKNDFEGRIRLLGDTITRIECLSKQQVPAERERLRERVRQLMQDGDFDPGRLELELVLLADRLDVTEECVRFRSHNKFFLEALGGEEPAGRKLNFLVQEMHREANTIGSKSSLSEIAHLVVGMKEELEKLREQLQNIE